MTDPIIIVDKRIKTVKMFASITREFLGYQVCEIDERGNLLKLCANYESGEMVYYPTAEAALRAHSHRYY
jgi:hypothetical protein